MTVERVEGVEGVDVIVDDVIRFGGGIGGLEASERPNAKPPAGCLLGVSVRRRAPHSTHSSLPAISINAL